MSISRESPGEKQGNDRMTIPGLSLQQAAPGFLWGSPNFPIRKPVISSEEKNVFSEENFFSSEESCSFL